MAIYVKDLSNEEYLVLKVAERLTTKFNRIAVDKICEETGFSEKYVLNIIKKLSKIGSITYFEKPYPSIILLTGGIDLLALKKLSDKNIITAIGRQIGIGKESDIYDGLDAYGNRVSLKVYRLGRISFRGISKKRSYASVSISYKWIKRNYVSAKREFLALSELYRGGVSVPRPIYRVMHIIVMEALTGVLLHDLKECKNPLKLFEEIITEVKKAWEKGYVNGDLSEYNVFLSINENYKPILIDWPQAEKISHEAGSLMLSNDLKRLVRFFKKKFEIKEDKLMDIILKNNLIKYVMKI